MHPNLFMVIRAFSTDVISAKNMLVSPANRLIPLTRESCRILLAKISAPNIKRYGERGQPCLTPLEGLN